VWSRRGQLEVRGSIFLAVLTYALIAPRMKDYTYVLLLPAAFEVLRNRLAQPRGSGRWLIVAGAAALALPGTDLFWPYRSLFLAGWLWLMAVTAPAEPATPPSSSCSCQSNPSPG
jgi:hypothetical protein